MFRILSVFKISRIKPFCNVFMTLEVIADGLCKCRIMYRPTAPVRAIRITMYFLVPARYRKGPLSQRSAIAKFAIAKVPG